MNTYASKTGIELRGFEYLAQTGTYRARFDPDIVPASMASIAALAEVLDVDPMELEPIYESIDTDALDTLVGVRNSSDGALQVSFSVTDHEITARSDGTIEVLPLDMNVAMAQNGDTSTHD